MKTITPSFWRGRRVLLTGGTGFLGSHIAERLKELGADVALPRSKDYDFVKIDDAVRCMRDFKPQMVIHAAAFYGGIWINQTQPGKIHFVNLVMGANIFEAARLANVEKLVCVGTGCAYPGKLQGDLSEETIWDGPCHESVENYGTVKKVLILQGKAYKRQYDFDSVHLIITNLYGEGDSYNPDRSHVVAALIRKFVEAKQSGSPTTEVWGTGKPFRDFLYVRDAAEGIILAAEHYTDLEPLNIGTGIATSIRDLAETIQNVSGYTGTIRWNPQKPDGVMRKVISIEKLKRVLGWQPPHGLREGLERTIPWYEKNKTQADEKW